mmetsp:Transcript_6150/g.15857  ORF Transcript_6150/g.15857 Transcript_6150/m.15857 type:complete len:180 (-) Transcript_6150:788-1327(-)
MGRGPRRGGRKRFTDFKTLEAEAKSIKERKQREANGEEVTSSEEEDERQIKSSGSDSDSYESDSDSSDDGDHRGQKKKGGKSSGVAGLIEISNPNLQKKSGGVKARNVDMNQEVTLSRREREALEAQRAKERYFKLQKQGKTEQARKDLERLALIRKQREEAAKKRAEEKAKKDAAKNK